MDVYLNYVTVLMEYVIFKTNVKQDGTVLSVTKLAVKEALVTIVMIHVMDVYQIHVIVRMVSVQILLNVNLDGNLGNPSVI